MALLQNTAFRKNYFYLHSHDVAIKFVLHFVHLTACSDANLAKIFKLINISVKYPTSDSQLSSLSDHLLQTLIYFLAINKI